MSSRQGSTRATVAGRRSSSTACCAAAPRSTRRSHARVRGGFARLAADLTDLLRFGAYQLLHMHSVPPYAAIAQTVELAKRRHGIGASKLANAVLRRVDRERETLDVASAPVASDPIDRLALEYSHPRWLVARWVARWGAEETAPFARRQQRGSACRAAAVRHRARAARGDARSRPALRPRMSRSWRTRSVSPGGHTRSASSGPIGKGCSSCRIQPRRWSLVMRACRPVIDVVDLCAAPGGKTSRIVARCVVRHCR